MDIRGLFDKEYWQWKFSSKYKKLLWQIKVCQEDERPLHLSNGVVLDFEKTSIPQENLKRLKHELKEMYEGTRYRGMKGRQYWAKWLCDNEWFFENINQLINENIKEVE